MKSQNLEVSFSDPLGSYAIDHWVHHGWNKDIDVSHKDVNMRSHMVSKSVSKEGEKGWSIGPGITHTWDPQVPWGLEPR